MSDDKITQQVAELFDKQLLHVLENGREVMTRDGDVVRVEPTAADLNVIRQRLKDCGVTSMVVDDSPIASIVENMRRQGLRLANVDMESDDAATA
jgi:hypothetical protein